MILCETHCHTKEVSLCANVPAREIPALYKTAGYGAVIVTDHYNYWTLAELGGERKLQIERWLTGWRIVKEEGERIGLKIFLGMELALPGITADFLVYGFGEEFLLGNPGLAEESLDRAAELIHREGHLIFQAHPFRDNMVCAPPELLDGVEVFNGNARHNSRNGQAAQYAASNGHIGIAGSDFHEYEDLGRGGIWLPDDIGDNNELTAYLTHHDVKLRTL